MYSVLGRLLLTHAFVMRTATSLQLNSSLSNLPESYQLFQQLIEGKGYNLHIKPRLNMSENVRVDVYLCPVALGSLDEEKGQVTMTFYLEMHWTDEILTWDLNKFNQTECIFIPVTKVWIPNLQFIINNVASHTVPNFRDPVYVCFNGSVIQVTWVMVTVSVEFKVQKFPFDEQSVSFHIGHDVYGDNDVKPRAALRNSSQVREKGYALNDSPSWLILDYTCDEHSFTYASAIYSTYTAVSCNLSIKRRPAYYIVNFCIPSIFVTFLSLIGLHCISLASRERKSKFKLAMTSIVSLSVLTLTIADGMPRTSEGVSRFHIFYYSLLSLILFGTLLALAGVSVSNAKKTSSIPDVMDVGGLIGTMTALIALCVWFFSS